MTTETIDAIIAATVARLLDAINNGSAKDVDMLTNAVRYQGWIKEELLTQQRKAAGIVDPDETDS